MDPVWHLQMRNNKAETKMSNAAVQRFGIEIKRQHQREGHFSGNIREKTYKK